MTDEELMGLEREGARIAQTATDAFKEVARLCIGSDDAKVAVLAGYLRYLLEEMPEADPEQTVHTLCNTFGNIPMPDNMAEKILDRIYGKESLS